MSEQLIPTDKRIQVVVAPDLLPLKDYRTITTAYDHLANGTPVVTQLGNNFGYLADANNELIIKRILEAKGDTNNEKPFSAMLPTNFFLNIIDFNQIPPSLHNLLKNPEELENRLGLICHLRAPVKNEALSFIPKRLIGWEENQDGSKTPFVQNFFIKGHAPMESLRDMMFNNGMFLSVTTQNQHGTPEITTLEESVTEAKRVAIPLILTDEVKRPEVKGSWSIVNIKNITAVRDGNIPIQIVEKLLGAKINTSSMKESKYLQDQAFLALIKEINGMDIPPIIIKRAIISYLAGTDVATVLTQIINISQI